MDANDHLRMNGEGGLRRIFDRGSVKRPRFALIPFAELRPARAPAYLIKGLFPRTGICVIWGPPKCGKSFWVTDAMLHVALRWTYRGRKVMQGSVVYCAFEGQEGYGKRIEAFRQHHAGELPAHVPFSLMPARADLIKEHRQLIKEVAEQLGCRLDEKSGQVSGSNGPAAIVLDTLNRSLAGSETDDMGAYVRAADALREAFDCCVIIVHHCGVEGTRPRGHTSLTGAADAQIAVKRDAAGNVVATVEWLKDGPEGAEIVSRLAPVTVGQDDEGDDVTTCIVEAVEGGPVRPAGTTNRKLSDRQRLALEALSRCASDTGVAAPASWGLPASVRAVKADDWTTELYRANALDKDAANPREDRKRLRQALAARGLIGMRDDLVWRI